MKKLFVLVLTTLGSSLGWWLGDGWGIMGSFVLSMVGFGFGMYYGAKLSQRFDL